MYGRRALVALAILVGALISTSFVGRANAQADPQTDREWQAINDAGFHRVEIVTPPLPRGDDDGNYALRLRVLAVEGARWAVVYTDDFGPTEVVSDVDSWAEMTARTSADVKVQARYSGDSRDLDTDIYPLDGGEWATTIMSFRGGYAQYMRRFELWFVIAGFDSGDTILVDLDRLVYESTGPWGNRLVLDEFGTAPTGIAGETPRVTPRVTLAQNVPNPFNPRTTIPFELSAAGAVRLDVYNIGGRKVATLVDGFQPAGTHAVSWDGLNAAGTPVPSGTYLARLTAGGTQLTRSMLLVK